MGVFAKIAVVIAIAGCGRFGFESLSASGDGGAPDGSSDASTDGALDDAPTVQGNWTPIAPALPAGINLFTVWAFGANAIWVGGGAGALRQFDGTTWLDRAASARDVNMLWGAAANDLWKVGPQCEVQRWNGSMWTTVTVPNCGNNSMFAVRGTVANDLWLAGVSGSRFRYTGAFTEFPEGNNVDFWGIFSVSASDVYFVGSRGSMLHWNGTTMIDEHIPTTQTLTSVWGASANDLWVVGTGGIIYRKQNAGIWIQQTSPTTQSLYSMWGTSANDVWAVGASGVALHYDGVSWQKATVPTTAALRGIAPIPGGGLVAVGDNGTVLLHP